MLLTYLILNGGKMMNENVENNGLVRIVVVDISQPLGSSVYDEAILPVLQATSFVKKYIDVTKYRIITI